MNDTALHMVYPDQEPINDENYNKPTSLEKTSEDIKDDVEGILSSSIDRIRGLYFSEWIEIYYLNLKKRLEDDTEFTQDEMRGLNEYIDKLMTVFKQKNIKSKNDKLEYFKQKEKNIFYLKFVIKKLGKQLDSRTMNQIKHFTK